MSLRRQWPLWLLGTALALAGTYSALCLCAYATGARYLPGTLRPADDRVPAAIRAQYREVEAPTAKSLPRLNPLTFVPYVLRDMHDDRKVDDEYRLLMSAGRVVLYSDRIPVRPSTHRLPEIAAVIKISRQWTLDQAMNTVLAESRFRQDVIGIEAAARFYFGVSAARLHPQESLALIVLLKGPSWYDPVCNRERFDRRYAQIAEKLGKKGPEWAAAGALSRLRPIGCGRG